MISKINCCSVTPSLLKVNYSPYLVDIVLNGIIDSIRHKAKVKNGVLNLTLFKSTTEMWRSLEITDKDKSKDIRIESIRNQESLEEQRNERRKEKKYEDEKHSLRKQMALEEDERTRLENKKEEEKKSAEEQMYATFQDIEKKKHQAITKMDISSQSKVSKGSLYDIDEEDEIDNIYDDDDDIEDSIESTNKKQLSDYEYSKIKSATFSSGTSRISEDVQYGTEVVTNPNDIHDDDDIDAEIKYIPPPRTSGVSTTGGPVEILFTPRLFPTPMRESKASEEEDWIAKNRKHLKHHGVFGNKLSKGRCIVYALG